MMLTAHRINDLHHVYRCEHLPIRKIERRLRMSWRTIKKYLDASAQGPTQRQGESRLDPCEADTFVFLFTARRSFRVLIQPSRRRRPNVITGTLTGTASAPTCSGCTGAQDDVKAAEMLPFSPGLNILFESSERLLTEQLDYNLPCFVGVEIMIGDTAAWDGSGSGEGKPKARVKVRKHGRECLHTPCIRLGPQSGGLFRPELARERSVSIVLLSIS